MVIKTFRARPLLLSGTDTQDNSVAYGRFEQRHPARYRDGLLADS